MGKPKNDLTGKQFGKLRVIEYLDKGRYRCECQCTDNKVNEKVIRAWDLTTGRAVSCGCIKNAPKYNLKGKMFGDWKVLDYAGDGKWTCECQCENLTKRDITTYELTSGHTKSCGHNSGKLKDIKGIQFGNLVALEYAGDGNWLCECQCEDKTKVIVKGTDLRSGNTKSCGCSRKGIHLEDISGEKFGEWTVLNYAGDSYWNCRCSCGTERKVLGYSLKSGSSVNCGGGIHKYKDISGERFGMITALEYVGNGLWECICDCDKSKKFKVLGANLRNGSTRSCGCNTVEYLKETLLNTYGDYNSYRAHNPRTDIQMQTLNDKEKLKRLITSLTDNKNKPSLSDIAIILDIHVETLRRKLKEFNLINLIDLNNNRSKLETDIYSELKGDIQSDKQELKSGKELDILFKDKKIAVEVNGTYWHSSIRKNKFYHQQKTLECISKGIKLIHIFEYEWLDDKIKENIKIYVDALINNNRNKEIVEDRLITRSINLEVALDFINKNKISYIKTYKSNYIGVYSESELIAIAHVDNNTLNKIVFNIEYINSNNKEIVVLNMISYMYRVYGTDKIHIKLDITKGNSIKLENIGVILSDIVEPNFTLINTTTRNVEDNTGKIDLDTYNDEEILRLFGYLKIYDAGEFLYTINNQLKEQSIKTEEVQDEILEF